MIKKIIAISSLALGAGILIFTYTDRHLPLEQSDSSLADNVESMTPQESAKQINQNLLIQLSNSNPVNQSLPLPSSIADIDHNIQLIIDADGNLIVNEDVKELFEFYLTAYGEVPLEQLLTHIHQDLINQLTPPALGQAQAILTRYIDYKINLSTLSDTTEATEHLSYLDKLKLQKSLISELRSQHFNVNEYESFFEFEEQYDTYMLRRLEVTKNEELTDQERQSELEEIENLLPPEVQAVRKKANQYASTYESANEMREAGSSKEDIYQMRSQSLGESAATALAQLDEEKNQWKLRLTNYAQARNEIRNSGLSNSDQAEAIDQLVDSQFTGTERLRVRALDSTL